MATTLATPTDIGTIDIDFGNQSTTSHYRRILTWIDSFGNVSYRTVHHEVTPTSEDSARARRVELKIGGKALLLKVGDDKVSTTTAAETTTTTTAAATTTTTTTTITSTTATDAITSSSSSLPSPSSSSSFFGLFVLSAATKLNSKAIKKEFNVKNVRFANPQELANYTNGLVPGAVPPFGTAVIYHGEGHKTKDGTGDDDTNLQTDSSSSSSSSSLPLYVDQAIASDNDKIAFNAGSLTDSIIMSVKDYLRIAQPTKVFNFSKPAG